MAQYIDFAEYYDFDHAIALDIAFYRDFAAEYPAPILELACGAGRLVVPLAAAGHEVYGLDIFAQHAGDLCPACRGKGPG